MADLGGVRINKGKIGANTLGSGDAISGVIVEAPAASGLALNTAVVINSLKDADALGINAAFDAANFVNCYRHIREFFRMKGEGVDLHLMLVAQDTGAVDIVEDSVVDANDAPAKLLLIAAGGEIRNLAIALNPVVAPTVLNGINSTVYNAIAKAQILHDWSYENFMPVQILLEGRDFAGESGAADLRTLTSPKVSVVIGQDYNYAATLPVIDNVTDLYMQGYADIGTALGTLSACEINQNIGDNESFNLTNVNKDAWVVPGLSNHETNKEQFADLQGLEDKGYIFGIEYAGLDGVRWNNDHTCVEVVVDGEGNINEHTIAYGRTIDKAARELRKAYLPKVKTKQPVDPETGLLPPGVIKNFDSIGNTVLGDMIANLEITDGEAVTDPNSDLLVAKSLDISFKIVPYGNVGEIIGAINLKTSLT